MAAAGHGGVLAGQWVDQRGCMAGSSLLRGGRGWLVDGGESAIKGMGRGAPGPVGSHDPPNCPRMTRKKNPSTKTNKTAAARMTKPFVS